MKNEKSISISMSFSNSINSLSRSWHSKRPKRSLRGEEANSNATSFTAIASVSSDPSTLVAVQETREDETLSAPMLPASPVFPARESNGLNENQLWLHDLSFKNPPSQVVARNPEAKPDGFYFEKWLDDATKNVNSK